MQPGNYSFPLRRNAVTPTRLQLFCNDETGAEVPLDVTGSTFKLDVRLYPGQPGPPLLSLSSGNHINTVSATTGEIEINWPGVLTAIEALPTFAEAGDPTSRRIDTFAYDLLLIADGRAPQAIMEGTVPVSYGVTRA